MSAGHHAFIDLAVHDGLRQRYARSEALILCTHDLQAAIWANGAGAALFGFDNVYEFMDEWSGQKTPAHRQLAAAAHRRDGPGEHTVTLRLSAGLKSRLEPITLVDLTLDDGTQALLVAAAGPSATPSQAARAAAIIAGLDDDGTHVAVLDAAGEMLAASSGIETLAIDPATLRALATDVASEADRLVKRRIATAAGTVPAAIARLEDDPVLHLLFAVEAADTAMEPVPVASPPSEHADETSRPRRGDETAPQAPAPRGPAINAWSLDPTRKRPGAESDDAEPVGAADVASDADATEAAPEQAEQPREQASGLPDGFVFNRDQPPVRFVWKIDAEGRFSEISPDFAAVVGPNAADVVGRRFDDVAQVFGIDREGAIGDLLRRRDTWSGRSVSWPVQGTALTVPVDLAALPTYTRERSFDGFRGFGIVRTAEASEDPEAIGLTLTDRPMIAEPRAQDDAAETGAVATPEDAPESAPPASRPDAGAEEPGPDETSRDTQAANDDGISNAAPADDDPFHGETPALKFPEKPEQPVGKKIIDLDERRGRGRDPLSTGEQAAFREIGRRLAETFGRRPRKPAADDPQDRTDPKPLAKRSPAPPVEPQSDAAHPGRPANDRRPEAEVSGPVSDEPQPDIAGDGEPAHRDPGKTADSEPRHDAGSSDEDSSGPPPPPSRPNYNESLIDDLPIALIVHQGDRVHHANSEFFALTGHADVDALFAAGGIGSLFADDALADGAAAPRLGVLTLNRADGEAIAVNARLQSVLWHDRNALMMSLIPAASAGSDRSGALEVEVEELRSILETATDGVIILGEHGDIRSMNRSASALFDYEEAETRGAPFAKLFAHESQRAVMDYVNGLSEHGVASVLNDGREVIGREAAGGFIPLFMTIGRLSGSNGFCAVMRDITQWKRTEEDLRAAKYAAEQASSHKSEFLARVSHEIRTPLNAIIGFSDMMADERFGPIGNPRYLEYARDIGRSGKHVLDIVNDLLDISKIEAGEMDIEFAAVALNETIAETVSLLQPQANSQRVIIRTSLSSAVPDIVADQRSIKQVAINILSNAIRFTPAGGQIVVSTVYEASGSVVLRIRDTGIGMSRSDLEQAMKPFRQVDGTSRPREGTGLGLPLTRAMVEANRAQFDIRSTPNEGTLVEITFPSQRVLAD